MVYILIALLLVNVFVLIWNEIERYNFNDYYWFNSMYFGNCNGINSYNGRALNYAKFKFW